MIRAALLTAVILLSVAAGCVGCSFADPAPVRERPWWMSGMANPAFLVTTWGVIYTPPGRLDEFTARADRPLAPTAAALLEHEQTHARRQHAHGLGMVGHGVEYLCSAAFRWEEERAGYAVQFRALAARGIGIYPPAWVVLLMDPSYREMVDEPTARAWVEAEARAVWEERGG